MAAHLLINDVLLPDVRLAIFDKDGTIIDVHKYWASMVKYRAHFIAEKLGLDLEIEKGLMDSMGIIENGKKFVYSFDSGKMWLYENTKGGEVKKEIRDVETIRRYSARMNTFDAYNSNHLETLLDSGDKR